MDSLISSTPYIHVNSTVGMVSHVTYPNLYSPGIYARIGVAAWSTQGTTGEETKMLRLARFHFIGCFIAPFSSRLGRADMGEDRPKEGEAGCPGGPDEDILF